MGDLEMEKIAAHNDDIDESNRKKDGMAAHNDDIDELLDSALDDFQTLNLKPSSSKQEKTNETDDRKPLPTNIQGLGLGLPDLKEKKRGKQKIAASSKNAHVSETLDKLRQQTRETVKGLEATSGEGADLNTENLEDWVKQFEELTGSQDMESIVETMMQQLLSKEILYEPMKEIGERYPKWLEDHKTSLSEEDYNRYSYQHTLIQELKGVYETNPNNFTKIVELMQKMQECGHPPNDIVQELAPDFDLSQLGQLSPEMLEGQQNCIIM